MVGMTLSVLAHMLQEKDLKIPSATAPKLAEPLLPHFEKVRLCAHGHWTLPGNFVPWAVLGLFPPEPGLVSAELFSFPPGQQPCAAALHPALLQGDGAGSGRGEKALTRTVSQSLLPLFLRWHDENGRLAKASGETLLYAARLLRRRDLEELLTQERRTKVTKCLLRPAWKPQPQPGEGPWPRSSACRAGSCGPAQRRSQSSHSLRPTRGLLPSLGLHELCAARACWNTPDGKEGGAAGPQ
ncbi:uncharacterized protein LOC130266574 [Oenanthe melanoleuca]|uniref:uncharacterized protein LOC130266574 n=1 Tax=Oenanthe melanoleuca TaxID=2939378 RepID=UPI0024C19DF9|nr:uncharacterized protein LOC130266574 [Oenanthe melanoleuca]